MPLMTQEQLDLLGAETGAYSLLPLEKRLVIKALHSTAMKKKYLLPIIIYSTFHVVELFKPAIVRKDGYFIF